MKRCEKTFSWKQFNYFSKTEASQAKFEKHIDEYSVKIK